MIFMRQPLVFILTILRMLVFQIHKVLGNMLLVFTDAQNKVKKGHKEAIEANNNINREENEKELFFKISLLLLVLQLDMLT